MALKQDIPEITTLPEGTNIEKFVDDKAANNFFIFLINDSFIAVEI